MERITNHPAKQLGNPKHEKPLYSNLTSSERARLLKYYKELKREQSILYADIFTEHKLSANLERELIESRGLLEDQLNQILGGKHAQK